jgi:hypothetical protein
MTDRAVVAVLRDLVEATDDIRSWATNINCSGPWPRPILIKRECDKLRAAYQKHADTLACVLAPNVTQPDCHLRRNVNGVCTRSTCECEREGLGDQCIWLRPNDAELERRTGEPHIDGWPLYSGMPPAAQRDCRTCHYFTTKAGGCASVVLCVDANHYTATTPKQYWTSAADAPNVLEPRPNGRKQ